MVAYHKKCAVGSFYFVHNMQPKNQHANCRQMQMLDCKCWTNTCIYERSFLGLVCVLYPRSRWFWSWRRSITTHTNCRAPNLKLRPLLPNTPCMPPNPSRLNSLLSSLQRPLLSPLQNRKLVMKMSFYQPLRTPPPPPLQSQTGTGPQWLNIQHKLED